MAEVREHKNRQPFREHVRELRTMFTLSLLYVLIGSSIGYALYKPLFALLLKPYNSQLYFTTPAGAFNAIFKVSILFGLIIAIPFIVHRVYKFISPAFPQKIQFFTAKLLFMSAFFACAGISFGYFVSLPSTLHFLTTVGPDNIKALINVNDYLNFVFHYLFGLALIFQFPLVLLIINKITPLKPSGLMKYQRHVIAGSTVAAAAITPTTDPINMALMTIPIIMLYQIGVVFIWISNRKKPAAFYQTRPIYVEPVPINLIPANFGGTYDYQLSAKPATRLLTPVVIETSPSFSPQSKTVSIKELDKEIKVSVNVNKEKFINKLQTYVPGPMAMDILPPTASA